MPTSSGKIVTREPILTYLVSLCEFFGADACALYSVIDDMHPEEKKREFYKRFKDEVNVDRLHVTMDNTDQYDILKFIGVGEARYQKNWKISYSERPDKYVIVKGYEDHPEIPREGLTGNGCRINIITSYPKESIENSILRNKDNDDQKRDIHPTCYYCLVMPINYRQADKEKRVVLRFDIYQEDRVFAWQNLGKLFNISPNSDPTKMLRMEFNHECMCYQYLECNTGIVMEQSDKEAEDITYKRLYKGENLVHSLANLKLSGESNLNVQIHQLLSHLFFVFNRRTYVGQKDISDRVIYLADALFNLCYPNKPVSPQRTFSFRQHLEQFQKQETLMLYDLSRYRDHFMHQMHVFVLGYLIINSIGFDFFRIRLQEILSKSELDRFYEKGKPVITDDSVLRIWFLVAFFHDVSYALEELSAGISAFVNKMFENSVTFNMNRLPFEQFISDGDELNDALNEMCAHFVPAKEKDNNIIHSSKLQHAYYKMMLKCQDHAIFGALSLLNSKKFIALPNASDSKFEIVMAALAISFHNDVFNNTLIVGTHTLHFSDYPMEALLLYCDNVQEWGRIKIVHSPDGELSFEKFSYKSFEYDAVTKIIEVVLSYDGYLTEDLRKKISSFFNNKIAKLSFEPYKFRIRYEDGQSEPHPVKFH